MTLSEQSVPPKSWTSDVTFSYITNQTFIPGGRPIGNKCFFIFRFADISFGFITLVSYDTPYSIPQTPWNKKTSNIEGVLKRKYFKRGVQQSNSPTRERILKCNSLLYSSIYFLFNHIYIYYNGVVLLDAVGRVGLPFFNHPTGSVQQKRQKMRLVGRVGRPPTVFSL